MEGPKPQRVRKQRNQKKQNNKVEIDVKVKKKPKPSARNGTVTTATGLQLGYAVSNERADRKRIKQLERRMQRIQKEQKGPKIQDTMGTTLTLGPIMGSQLDGLNRSMRFWLNPIQLKPADAGATVTPLSVRASQYDLFKIVDLTVILQPLVGASVVTGSLIYVDLDQEASAVKPDNVDTVKARPHVEVSIGQRKAWKVPKRYLEGPRSGWWYVDTNEDPSQSLGPGINLWTYLRTTNIFADKNGFADEKNNYLGPLFMAEMKVRYNFANYNPKPALAQLATGHGEHKPGEEHERLDAKLANDEDGNVVLKIKTDAALAQMMNMKNGRATSTTKEEKSATIWTIAGNTVSAIAGALGPWGWLLKGGWWVIRKIFKAPTRNDDPNYDVYAVYASVEDAKADTPINTPVKNLESQPQKEQKLPDGQYAVKQVNEPNLNMPMGFNVTTASGRITPLPPPEPEPPTPPKPQEVWWLPLCREQDLPGVVPPLYTWYPPAPGTGTLGEYRPGMETQWYNGAFIVYGTPVVTRFTLKKFEDKRPLDVSLNFFVQNQKGQWSANIKLPTTDSWLKNATDEWYWLDLHDTGIIMASGKDDLRYSTQGVMHTARTFLDACYHFEGEKQDALCGWRKDMKDKLKLGDSTYEGWTVNWLNEIAHNMSADLTSDTLIVQPLACFGDPKKIALLLADANQNLFSVLAPAMTWPNSTPTEEIQLKWGLDVPFFGVNLWNPTSYITERQEGKIAFRKGPQVEKIIEYPQWRSEEQDDSDSGVEVVDLHTIKQLSALMKGKL
nr:capsid protein [Avian astrovirus]